MYVNTSIVTCAMYGVAGKLSKSSFMMCTLQVDRTIEGYKYGSTFESHSPRNNK